MCPQCGYHIGWMFDPEDTVTEDQERPSSAGFYGIVLGKVIHENFAESLTLAARPLN